jgi:hypothetical protein
MADWRKASAVAGLWRDRRKAEALKSGGGGLWRLEQIPISWDLFLNGEKKFMKIQTDPSTD